MSPGVTDSSFGEIAVNTRVSAYAAWIDSLIDIVAPTVTTKTPDESGFVTTHSADVEVTFSEAVTLVDATDLALSGPGSAGHSVGTPTSNPAGTVWTFPVSGLSEGQVDVSLAPTLGDIEDLAGNRLANTTWSFTVDTIAPTVDAKTPDEGALLNTIPTTIDVTFSEKVVNVEIGDLDLGGNGTVDSVTELPNNVWQFQISGVTHGPINVSLAPNPGDITDEAGNSLANTTWSFTVDTIPPTVDAKTPDEGVFVTTDALPIDVTFSEEVFGIGIEDLDLGGAGSVDSVMDLGNNVWQFQVSGLNEGPINVSLAPNLGGVTDVAGNALDGEWVNPDFIGDTNPSISTFPSGDGNVGGDFEFRVTVLDGDGGDDGQPQSAGDVRLSWSPDTRYGMVSRHSLRHGLVMAWSPDDDMPRAASRARFTGRRIDSRVVACSRPAEPALRILFIM